MLLAVDIFLAYSRFIPASIKPPNIAICLVVIHGYSCNISIGVSTVHIPTHSSCEIAPAIGISVARGTSPQSKDRSSTRTGPPPGRPGSLLWCQMLQAPPALVDAAHQSGSSSLYRWPPACCLCWSCVTPESSEMTRHWD